MTENYDGGIRLYVIRSLSDNVNGIGIYRETMYDLPPL